MKFFRRGSSSPPQPAKAPIGPQPGVVSLKSLQEQVRQNRGDATGPMIRALEKGLWPEHLCANAGAISAQEQIALLKSCAAVVGLGGLGGHIATLLARAGVGSLVLCDPDSFEPSNLNRQAFCTQKSLGWKKAHIAAGFLESLGGLVNLKVLDQALTAKNALEILQPAHIVLDALDSPKPRLHAWQAAMKLNIPFVHGAVSGWSGQVATLAHDGAATLFDIYPQLKTAAAQQPGRDEAGQSRVPEDEKSRGVAHNFRDAQAPKPSPSVLAPAPATIAAIQVTEAIRILIGNQPAYLDKLLHWDGKAGSMKIFSL
ncbi:MAG: ThiF family adenylyltransferase [Desulfatibacillaceae bacterium]|nr:ThiF family adenylyltransferase [Desulfatibacillaceae bacterium]